ncbi:CGNR zinc finger domain-containing protein [Streptomyces sp. V4-01]|uniref:CGNR zinc finger domain-containing protein n=1 Tax=Actinacidiphila polyblastidii TaxID=3110430 RepID=A0ABU7PH30_9ACTN|nr:CGNR zinc finger domain-containing protein [Streptomyces sp. V4-01]
MVVDTDATGTALIDTAQEDALLELLNTAPVVKGAVEDRLSRPDTARAWQRAHGGTGTETERRHLVEARDALWAVIRADRAPSSLTALLEGVVCRPAVGDEGLGWRLDAPEERGPAVRAVLTWGALRRSRPDRLRPCANPECRLFLLDRSKTNKARWCSMAVCGNRMKARRHYERVHGVPPAE